MLAFLGARAGDGVRSERRTFLSRRSILTGPMQRWLCLQFFFTSVCAISIGTRSLQPEANFRDDLLPGVPVMEEAADAAHTAELANQWSSSEMLTAAAGSDTSSAVQSISSTELNTIQNELVSIGIAGKAKRMTERTFELRKQAAAIAKETQDLVQTIPDATKKAAEKAVNDVMVAEIEKLNKEVSEVLDTKHEMDVEAEAKARAAAAKASLPFQEAKRGAVQAMYGYATQAQNAASSVRLLKNKAMEIAQNADMMQRQGKTVAARRLQQEARGLMTRATELEGPAQAYAGVANTMHDELPSYDVAGKAAADLEFQKMYPPDVPEIPDPPKPLTSPPPPALGPAPGPAPA